MIRRQPKLPARPQDAGDLIQILWPNEAPLVMARLRPGIGKEHENRSERRRAQAFENVPRVTHMDTNIGKALSLDVREQFRTAVHERLAGDEAGVRTGLRLSRDMLAATRANLKRNVPQIREKNGKRDRPFAQ